ncbi:uncharacterized protein LOC119599066 [Penaeus monodon]|uniref:uncharacterized protein LOC119599066 n=1 Tax=Penaeus monodon TaxID=6687 RepID=UPI0018A79150|nr:uncharacterized protein LOC119599066 [Penaeus monodon]
MLRSPEMVVVTRPFIVPGGSLRAWRRVLRLQRPSASSTFRRKEGERKRRLGMKEKAEKLVGGERADGRGHEEKGAKKGEDNNRGAVPEKQREKEGKKGQREEEVRESLEGPKTLEMSLRRFALEGSRGWPHAVTNITEGIGTSIPIPTLLEGADFAFLDMKRTHLHHARAGWGGHVTQHGGHDVSTAVVCAMEGQLQFLLSPFSLQWQSLQCGGDECLLQVPPDKASDEGRPEVFLARAQVLPGSCLYMPQGWQWHARAEGDTTFLWLAWEDDLVLRDDVIAALLPLDEDDQGRGGEGVRAQREPSAGGEPGAKKGKPTDPAPLWEILPTDPPPPLVLWGEQDPLPHLLDQYLLSDHQLDFDAFYERFRIDRQLLPDLVDCPPECRSLAASIFSLLDASADGLLNQLDATYLTRASVRSLTLQLDDLLDELRDMGTEQWVRVVQGDSGPREAFLGRAKDRMVSSAQSQVRRWIDGDLDGADEEALKEHLPELYSQVVAAREHTDGKEEL